MIRSILPQLVLAALLAPAAAAPVPKDKKDVLYFPTAVGASWTYSAGKSEFTEVVTSVERKDGGAVVVAISRDTKGRITPLYTYEVSAKGLFRVATGKTPLDPPRCLLKLPAKDGDTWDHEPKPKMGWKGKYVFKGEEEVEVPAGKYKALKVEAELQATTGPNRTTYWYAP